MWLAVLEIIVKNNVKSISSVSGFLNIGCSLTVTEKGTCLSM
jgi:hypothetical protein